MPENNIEELELRSDEVQEILTKVPHWMIRWGNLLFLFLILMVLLISWFVKYPDLIVSEAIITTQSPPQREYARSSGKIEAIFVEDNQEVHENMPLAVLENTANFEDVFGLKSIVDTITINSQSFYFPLDSLLNPFLGDIETPYALFENSYTQYILNKRYRPFSNETAASQYSVTEMSRQLDNLKAQSKIKKKQLSLAEVAFNRQKGLYKDGVIAIQDYENEQLKFERAKVEYEIFEMSLSQSRE